MKAIVEQLGPVRARLYIKGIYPQPIHVPVGWLPVGVEKGDTLIMTFSKDGEKESHAVNDKGGRWR